MIDGPTIDYRAFLSGRGVVTNFISPTDDAAFTASFGDRSFDESAAAARAARAVGADHEVIEIRPDVRGVLDHLIHCLDEPMADSSAIPTYWLCQATRRRVTVALSGDGGDELLAGYRRYVGRRLAGRYNALPAWTRALGRGLARALPDPGGYTGKSLIKKFQKFVDQADQVAANPKLSRIDFLSRPELAGLLAPDALAAADRAVDPFGPLFDQAGPVDPVAAMQWVDLRTYLPDDILVKVDRMAFAHALEVRPPLLDHHLVEFLGRLPLDLKLRGLTTKHLLKRAARRILPGGLAEEVINRPKQGFEAPVAAWFRGELRDLARQHLERPELERAGVFRPGAAMALLDRHASGRADLAQVLWGLLVMDMWMRRFRVGVA